MRTILEDTGSGFLYNKGPIGNRSLATEFPAIMEESFSLYGNEDGCGYGFGRGFGHISGRSSMVYENYFPFELIQYFFLN